MAQWRQYSQLVGSWELSGLAAAFGVALGFSAACPRATGNNGSAEVPTRKPPSEPRKPRREVRLATARVEFSVKESNHFMRFTDSLLDRR